MEINEEMKINSAYPLIETYVNLYKAWKMRELLAIVYIRGEKEIRLRRAIANYYWDMIHDYLTNI